MCAQHESFEGLERGVERAAFRSLKPPAWRIDRRDFLRVGGTALLGIAAAREIAAAPSERKLRFGIVTDIHYADAPPYGTRFYRESLSKLAECVQRMKQEGVDFLIELGDFKDQGRPPEEAQTLRFLETVEKAFRRFPGPVYHVPGNHDFDSISLQQYLARIRNAGRIPRRGWYSFDVKGLHCVVFDNNFRSDGAHYDHGSFDWKDANVPPEELEWLEKDLAAGVTPTLVFSHQLFDGEGAVFVKNAAEVRKVFEKSGRVIAVFQGHHHPGRYSRLNGIHYYTLKAMVEGSGAGNNAYAVVDVLASGDVIVTGYRKAVSMRLGRTR